MPRVKVKKSEVLAEALRTLILAIMPDDMSDEDKQKELNNLVAQATGKASAELRRLKRPDIYNRVKQEFAPVVPEEPVVEEAPVEVDPLYTAEPEAEPISAE